MTYKTEVLKMAFEIDNDFESTVQIKVIGVGGGGGNAATAGAQMQGVSVKDALDKLIASIDAFYEE